MSQAEALLDSLSANYSDEGPHITVNGDRTITVPNSLKHIAVSGDHNIETVTFDCPRYWDGHDFSTMKVYINFQRPDGFKDSCPVKNLRISDKVDSQIQFEWTLTGNATAVKGNLSFLVYIETSDADPCWHSRLNQDLIVDEGLDCKEQIARAPDSIEAVLARTTADYTAQAKAEIEGKAAQVLATIPEDYTEVNNMAKEALRKKANAIELEAEGEVIFVDNSADAYLLGLKVFGKTTQVQTTGAQMFDKDSAVTGMLEEDGSIVVDGAYVTSDFVPITPRTAYHQTDKNSIRAKYYDANKNPLSDTWDVQITSAATFTTFENAHFIRLTVSVKLVDNFMLNAGTTGLPYEPYSGGVVSPSPECPQDLVSIENPIGRIFGKNLLKTAGVTQTVSGVAITVHRDGSFTVKGTAEAAVFFGVNFNIRDLTPGEVYALTGCPAGGSASTYRLYAQTSDGTKFAGDVGNGTKFTATDEQWQVLFVVYGGNTVDLTVFPMLRLASVADDSWEAYAPRQEVQMSHHLAGIPVDSGGNYTDANGQQWICDEIDFERGAYVQRVKSIAFTGAENWDLNAMASNAGVNVYQYINTAGDMRPSCGYCTHFAFAGGWSDGLDTKFEVFWVANANVICLKTDGVETLEAFKNWVTECYNNSSPLTVYYASTENVENPLSDAEIAAFMTLRTNLPNTTVLNDAGAHMAIKYSGDTTTCIKDNPFIRDRLLLKDVATGVVYALHIINGEVHAEAVS